MADGDAKGVVKRIHMNVDLSPNMEDNRPLKISRVQSPEPETLAADTPEWAKIMYRSLNGVNKLAITEIREQFNHLQHKFEDMKIANITHRSVIVGGTTFSFMGMWKQMMICQMTVNSW